MSNVFTQIPSYGDYHFKAPVADSSSLPASGNTNGDCRIALADATIWVWGGSSWTQAGGGSSSFNRLSALSLTRVTSTPANLGEYRCLTRAADQSSTGSDIAPTVSPNSSDGFYLNPTAYMYTGSADYPCRYIFYIGANKDVKVEFYKSSGFSGHVSASQNQWRYAEGSSFDSRPTGPIISYNSSSGILVVDTLWTDYFFDGNHLFHFVSPDTGSADIQAGAYCDVLYR